jgi:hypothetical protein
MQECGFPLHMPIAPMLNRCMPIIRLFTSSAVMRSTCRSPFEPVLTRLPICIVRPPRLMYVLPLPPNVLVASALSSCSLSSHGNSHSSSHSFLSLGASSTPSSFHRSPDPPPSRCDHSSPLAMYPSSPPSDLGPLCHGLVYCTVQA